MPRRRSVLILLMFWCVVGVRSLAAQDFYEQQFQSGRTNLASGKALEAATQLRIAAFGFLDRPSLLTEALVHLAVAQSAVGHVDDAAETVTRFMTIEQRFPSYAGLQLDPRVSAPFESLVLKVVPPSTVAATPSLARLVRSDVQKVADLPAARRMAAYEAGFRKDSRNIQWPLAAAREAATRRAFDEMVEWGTRALSLDRNNKEALAILVRARTARRECRETLTLLGRFSRADLDATPDLYADQLVCLTETGRIDDADLMIDRVPQSLRTRADVTAASKRVNDAKRPVRTAVVVPPPPTVTPQPKTTTAAAAPQTASVQPKTPAPATTTRTPAPQPKTPDPVPAPRTEMPQPKTPSPVVNPPKASPTRTADEILANARLQVRQRKFADAVRDLKAGIAANGTNRAMRLALLEAAALAKDWPSATEQMSLLSPLARGEELYMFYAAMTMYETGRRDDARPMLERALPRIVSSPLVEYYAKAILGRS